MTAIYRPTPPYPGYEASSCGIIRRAETSRISKLGKVVPMPALMVKRSGRNHGYVQIDGSTIPWVTVWRDAWPTPDDGRPASWYADGRVVTLSEWVAEREGGATCRPAQPVDGLI